LEPTRERAEKFAGGMAADAPIGPTFDSEGKLRVLPAAAAAATEELEREARAFVSDLQEFTATVGSVVESMGSQAAVIEAEKLRAIGFRVLAEQEKLLRARKLRELPMALEEKAKELARLAAEHDSLLRVEADQKETLEALTQ
jgi:hypothetical protein